jgi:hypothetical protein
LSYDQNYLAASENALSLCVEENRTRLVINLNNLLQLSIENIDRHKTCNQYIFFVFFAQNAAQMHYLFALELQRTYWVNLVSNPIGDCLISKHWISIGDCLTAQTIKIPDTSFGAMKQ